MTTVNFTNGYVLLNKGYENRVYHNDEMIGYFCDTIVNAIATVKSQFNCETV